MFNCDLCNKQIKFHETVHIPLRELQEAVREGFNPYQTYGIDMSEVKIRTSLMGVSPEQMFQHWQQKVMADITDWNLCTECDEAFRRARAYGYDRGNITDPIVGQHYHTALWSYFRKRMWDPCIAELTEAIGIDPNFAEGYYWRAKAHFEKAIQQEAEGLSLIEIVASCERSSADYSKVVELNPSDRVANMERNMVFICLGRTDEVVQEKRNLSELSEAELRIISRPYADRYEYLGIKIKKLTEQLKSHQFEGRTVIEAQAAAEASGINPERIYDTQVTREVVDAVAEVEGENAELAIEAARSSVPPEAFDIHSPEIVQEKLSSSTPFA